MAKAIVPPPIPYRLPPRSFHPSVSACLRAPLPPATVRRRVRHARKKYVPGRQAASAPQFKRVEAAANPEQFHSRRGAFLARMADIFTDILSRALH